MKTAGGSLHLGEVAVRSVDRIPDGVVEDVVGQCVTRAWERKACAAAT